MRYVSIIFSVIFILDLSVAESVSTGAATKESNTKASGTVTMTQESNAKASGTVTMTQESNAKASGTVTMTQESNAKASDMVAAAKDVSLDVSQRAEGPEVPVVIDGMTAQKIEISKKADIKSSGTGSKTSNETTEKFAPSYRDLWRDSALNFDALFKSEQISNIPDMNSALEIIRRQIINCSPGQYIDQYAVFAELRSVFSKSEFSTEELMTLIEDAMEIKKKYLLIFDFVIRSEYARRTVKEGVNAEEVLQFASSEYIQLPKFILKSDVDSNQLDDVLSDLGCGVVWKDRAKYLFVLNKYFGKREIKSTEQTRTASATKADKVTVSSKVAKPVGVTEAVVTAGAKKTIEAAQTAKSTRFPRRIQNYLKLIEEVDKFFGESYNHLIYLIAQDFYYADVPQEKIKKIFSFSDREWEFVVKPNVYK